MASDLRVRLLHAAIGAVGERGYDGVRLRDVAAVAGASVGAVQHHFASREALLQEALAQSSEDLRARWREIAAAQGAPWDRLVALMEWELLSGDVEVKTRSWTAFCAAAASRPQIGAMLRELNDEWRRLVVELVEDGVRRGEFAPLLSVPELAEAIVAQCDGGEVSLAAGLGALDAWRLRALVLRTAAVLLGLPASAAGEAPELPPPPAAPAPPVRAQALVFSAAHQGERGGPEAQLRQALASLERELDQRGASVRRLARLVVYVDDAGVADVVDAVLRDALPAPPPVTVVVTAGFATPRTRVALDAVAWADAEQEGTPAA